MLGADTCPMCTYVAEVERSYFAWFVAENYSAASVRGQLRTSLGMCPTHSRRLMEDPGPGPILTTVVHEALTGAAAHLREPGPGAPCPACAALSRASDDARHLVVHALATDSEARRFQDHAGLCLKHVLEVGEIADLTVMTLVAERLLESLGTGDMHDALARLATDDDVQRRARWRERLAEPDDTTSTIAQLCARLEVAACPVCLAAGLGERRYLEWFLDNSRRAEPSLRTDPGELCAAHLRDAVWQDPEAAGYALERKRDVTASALSRLLDCLSPASSPTGRRRHADEEVGEHLRGTLLALHPCPACRAGQTAEQRQLELLDAALSITSVRAAYETSHGLCVRHVARLGSSASAQTARRVAIGRVAVLAWEVGEIHRRYAWACRHEPAGPERDAWLRGLVQIDGQTLLGAPPPPHAPDSEDRS